MMPRIPGMLTILATCCIVVTATSFKCHSPSDGSTGTCWQEWI